MRPSSVLTHASRDMGGAQGWLLGPRSMLHLADVLHASPCARPQREGDLANEVQREADAARAAMAEREAEIAAAGASGPRS